MRTKISGFLAAALVIFSGGLVFASEEELRQEINILKQRLAQLEKKLAEEGVEGETATLSSVTKDIKISGFVDTSYTYSFNGPDSRTNTARVFDTQANNFNVQAFELVLEKPTPDTGGVGFRTDLFFGEDAQVITPAGSTSDEFDLQQAYLDILMPAGRGLSLKAGKFVTLHGAEVIESKDNWNFSRSLLFGYAIPFTHTGLRATYPFSDTVSLCLGVSNGWDNVNDNNNAKSVEGALTISPLDNLSLSFVGMYGPENTGDDHSQRTLFDFVATYQPLEKWTLKLNYDWAEDERGGLDANADAEWEGLAGYVRYDANDWLSFTTRLERFDDRDGVRVVSGTPQDLWEGTFTTELRPWKDLIARLEYRHDESDKNVFTDGSTAVDNQDTVGVELIYPF